MNRHKIATELLKMARELVAFLPLSSSDLDLMSKLQDLDEDDAARYVKKLLKGSDKDRALSGLILWNNVMLSKAKDYVTKFKGFSGEVAKTADKLLKSRKWLTDLGAYEDDTSEYLEEISSSGSPRGSATYDFVPKAYQDYYLVDIDDVSVGMGEIVMQVLMMNKLGERETVTVEMDAPEDAEDASASIVSGGHQNLQGQQTILIEISGDEEDYDAQVDFDNEADYDISSQSWH